MYLQAAIPSDFNPFAMRAPRLQPTSREPERDSGELRRGRFLPTKDGARVALEAVELVSWLAGPLAVAAVLIHG